MNEVLDAIAKRSSTRAYTGQKLSKEQLDALITAALQAPTARNMQEVHISVLDGDDPVLGEIDAERRQEMIKVASDENVKRAIENDTRNFYYNAPTVFILSADKDFKWSRVDAGIASATISLAAQSLGLGSLIIGIIDKAMKGDKERYFAQKLRFPENYGFVIAVAVGYKNTEKEPHTFDRERSVSFI